MKTLIAAVLILSSGVGAAHAANGFAPGNPWFGQFEQTCRAGNSLADDCRGSVVGAYAEHAKAKAASVACDFQAFWSVKDARYSGKVVSVLPWQDVVAQIVAQPGVCRVTH